MRLVAYYRVSTVQQGRSGLGLEAQESTVAGYAASVGGEVIARFVEVETGKGANALDRRPQLKEALQLCQKEGARLVIAKLDRLARNVHFISGLIESGVEFVAADMPQANKVMIQMYAVMSEWERDQISARTKAALAAAKARGTVLGAAGPENLARHIEQRQRAALSYATKLAGLFSGFAARNLSQRSMARELSELGIPTPAGKAVWSLVQVQRVLARIGSRALECSASA